MMQQQPSKSQTIQNQKFDEAYDISHSDDSAEASFDQPRSTTITKPAPAAAADQNANAPISSMKQGAPSSSSSSSSSSAANPQLGSMSNQQPAAAAAGSQSWNANKQPTQNSLIKQVYYFTTLTPY